MKKVSSLYLLLFFLIFFPVLDVSGHFINIVEFYIYGLFLFNVKKIIPVSTVKIYIVYMILFFGTVIFTSIIASKPVNNYDIFLLRNCAQLVCLLSVLYRWVVDLSAEKTPKEFKEIILKCFYILSLPAVLVYIERANILHAREIVNVLYKPQFFFLGADVFTEFRYTSVFKDFFTAGVYFIILTSSIYYFYLTATLEKKQKLKLGLLMLMIYVSQVFVSRSSLVLIPFNLVLMTLFASKASFLTSMKRLIAMVVITIPVFAVLINLLMSYNLIQSEWVSEGLNVVTSGSDSKASSSFAVMQNWNQNFFQYISDHPDKLFVPNHEYDLQETSGGGLYTDGFYPQEIYRYGIYGMIAYFYLVLFLFKEFIKNHKGLVVIILSFVLLNYKGGNVFFMPKNIYLYAFIITAFLILDVLKNEQEQTT